MIKRCARCGKEFATKYPFQKYCSKECRHEAQREYRNNYQRRYRELNRERLREYARQRYIKSKLAVLRGVSK